MMTYLIIAAILIAAELLYFRLADRFNIIDKPNERSSHTKVVIRGGGIIFTIGLWVWSAFFGFPYPWMLAAVTLAAGVSFIDDIHSLPDSVRLVVQFAAMGLMIFQVMDNGQWTMDNGEWIMGNGPLDLGRLTPQEWTMDNGWLLAGVVVLALIVCVGATNIYNFMDGINGITAGYSLAVLIPLAVVNGRWMTTTGHGFVEESLLVVIGLSLLVFSWFNFRPKNKAKCFAGDVGSVGMAFILLFVIGLLIMRTGDITWLVFLVVYGVDGCCTILHRIMLHENLGEAHRKHAYQLMANELGMSHVAVSIIYMSLQLLISLGFVFLCPETVVAHWVYVLASVLLLAAGYGWFMRRYYHLHEEYLRRGSADAPNEE